jgi:hypothetical protein
MPAGIGEFAPRAVCSDAERRAAVWAHDELRARGHEAWMETHWVRPQRALALALGCALTAVGGLVAIAAPVAGLALAAIGAISVLADAAGRPSPLRLLMLRRATQVVLVAAAAEGAGRAAAARSPAGPAPAGRPAVDLLVVARSDVPRRGVAVRALARAPGGLWWLAAAAVAVAAAAGARVAGADGTALGIAQLVPTVVLMVAVALAADAHFAPLGDGRDEDAAIEAALALHDGLAREPPPGLRAGLILAGPDALRAHLRRERLDPRRTALLQVRAGDVRSRHPQWLAAAEAAGIPARRRGPRGLPAALAPPEHAEALARALTPKPA